MAHGISWIHPVRAAQLLFGLAVFGLIIYILSVYKYDDVVKFMLFNGIWTGFFATPYLSMAPVYFPKLGHYFVVPVVETITMIVWLVGVILLGIALPSSGNCNVAGCEAMLATVVLSALECAMFLATAIRSIIHGVQIHHRVTKKAQKTQPVPEAEASGAMESV